MKNRRHRFKPNNDNINYLSPVKRTLQVLIAICLIIFIISSIKMKNRILKQNNLVNTINNVDTNYPTNITTDIENSIPIENNGISKNNTESSEHESKSTTINMALTGDIMCQNTIYKDAYNSETDSYNFSYLFEDIKYNIQTADISIGNLETTLSGAARGYSSSTKFNTPENLAINLKKLGFDVLTTANNHCYDFDYSGLESTIDYLNEADIAHTGTFRSEEEQNKILIQNIKGINIAILSFTYGTNGITVPSDKSYSVNLINKDLIQKQLSNAKSQNPDLICVSMHWGKEYQTTPNDEQTDLANFLFNNGADIIIGNHPHVLQPMEKRELTLPDGSKKDGFIVYSLGNFLSDQNKPNSRSSAILNLNITKNEDGKISINTAKYTPIYTFKNTTKNTNQFKIINLKNTIAGYEAGYTGEYTQANYTTFKTELANVQKMLGDEIK